MIRGKLRKAPQRRPIRRKPVKGRKPRKCPHSIATMYGDICDEMKCWQCIRCYAKGVRCLGISNDESDAVRVEMAAADLYSLGYNKAPPFDGVSFLSLFGFANHEKKLLTGGVWPPRNDGDVAWLAGWLLRELATHSNHEPRDREAWTWDVRRPVAGQYEEWRRGVDYNQELYLAHRAAASTTAVHAGGPGLYATDDRGMTIDEVAERAAVALALQQADSLVIAPPACPSCDSPFGCEPGQCVLRETLTECCHRKQWGDGEHDADCRNLAPLCGVDGHFHECNCDQQAGPWLDNTDDDDPPMTAVEYEAQRIAELDIRDDDDCPDCAACTTTEGCAEHEQFTCESCGDLKPWTEGSADEQDGECDTCWHDRTSGSGAPSAENEQIEEP